MRINYIKLPYPDMLEFQSDAKRKPMIRVMIVDDHPQVRRALRVFLDVWDDFELVGEAESGEQAIELAGQLRPDVVLMDLVLPDMDGAMATRIIRQEFPDVQVIALTSTVDYKLIDKALKAGAHGYVLKTTTLEALSDAIREAVQ